MGKWTFFQFECLPEDWFCNQWLVWNAETLVCAQSANYWCISAAWTVKTTSSCWYSHFYLYNANFQYLKVQPWHSWWNKKQQQKSIDWAENGSTAYYSSSELISLGKFTNLFSSGVFSFFLSYCCLFATNRTAGDGSRHNGSSVANSNLLSKWNTSSCVHWLPSLVRLLMSDNNVWNVYLNHTKSTKKCLVIYFK